MSKEDTVSQFVIKDDAASRRVIAAMILGAGLLQVSVDPRHSDVDVPDKLRDQVYLTLNFGYDLTPPVTDLCIEERWLSGWLTFNGYQHHVVIPWLRMFGMGDGHGQHLFYDKIPAELRKPALVGPHLKLVP